MSIYISKSHALVSTSSHCINLYFCVTLFIFFFSNGVVIHAWANSKENGAIQRAHQILVEMQSLRKSGERPDLIPDAISFTSIVSAIAHDKRQSRVKETQKILDTMFNILKDDGDDGGIEMDRVAYNALIHAQSKQSGSADKAEMLLDYMLEKDGNSAIRPVRNTL